MNIRGLLETQTEKYPDKTFLFFEDEKITYLEFNSTVNKVANAFQKMGVGKADMVALMIPNSPEFLYTWMALNKLGAVEVPINVAFMENEIEYILKHSGSVGIVIHEDYYPIFMRINKASVPNLRWVVSCGTRDVPEGIVPFSDLLSEKGTLAEVEISDEDIAVCIYTSGTTDRPKAVLNSHKNWVLTGEAYAYTVGITPEDRVMTPNPLFHANAQVYSTMGSLAAGAGLVLLERFSSSRILEQARHFKATKMVLVQAVTPWVWGRPKREDDGENPVKTMVAGNVPKEIYDDFEKRFQLKIQTIYSLTEAVLAIMGPREGTQPRKPGGIGVPMEHPDPIITNEIKIVDDNGTELPAGKNGEIVIRNSATMVGYFKDPDRTQQTKRNGWIHTGDLGFRDEDGYFFFVGRKKEVIRRRGELISSQEIETLLNSHPSIEESAVIGVPSGLGSGEEEIKAYVRLASTGIVAPQEIISWLSGKIADFKIPRFIEFREEFPRSAIGRIQKNILKDEGQKPGEGCYDRLKE